MKKVLFLSVLLVLGFALCANAETWQVTAYAGNYGTGVANTPAATLNVTRIANASGTWDELDINLAAWLIPSWQTGGPNGVGLEVNGFTGTFSVDNPATQGFSLTGTTTTWKNKMTWNYANASPTAPAPQSFANFENNSLTPTRTGTSPNWTSVYGGWYGNTDGSSNLQVVDTSPPSDPNLDDGKDETLIARFYVTPGTNINFLALDDGIGGLGFTNGVTYRFRFDTAVPEPGTIVLLASSLMGLLCYAWRKRK